MRRGLVQGLETVTLLPSQGRDAYGDPMPGEAAPVEVSGVLVQPGPSPEHPSRLRDGVVVDLTLHMPWGAPVPTRDQRVEVRGQVFEVDEEPAVWSPGDMAPGAIVVSLRRGEG